MLLLALLSVALANHTPRHDALRQAAQEALLPMLESHHISKSTSDFTFVRFKQAFWTSAAGAVVLPTIAQEFLTEHGIAFGVTDVSQLELTGQTSDFLGWTHLTYRQTVGTSQRIEVVSGVLKLHFDEEGRLSAVSGMVLPSLPNDPQLECEQEAALSTAQRYLQAMQAEGSFGRQLRKEGRPEPLKPQWPSQQREQARPAKAWKLVASEVTVYKDGLLEDKSRGEALLSYKLTMRQEERTQVVLVEAQTCNKVLVSWSLVAPALHREIYEHEYNKGKSTPVWLEGDPFPGYLTQDEQNLVQLTEETYWFFRNAFARDSFDEKGGSMIAVANWTGGQPSVCPNAQWTGAYIRACSGVAGIDVIAHEWAHAYTERTAELIYAYQSGAINEALSDIWGETVNLLSRRRLEPQTARSPGACSSFKYDNSVNLTARAGPTTRPMEAVSKNAPLGVIRGLFIVPDKDKNCTHDGDLNGAFFIIDFLNSNSTCFGEILAMASNKSMANIGGVMLVADTYGSVQLIMELLSLFPVPFLYVKKEDGDRLLEDYEEYGSVEMTMTVFEPTLDKSYRWLIGEDSPAIGVLRDGWRPECLGLPGSTASIFYMCLTNEADFGGVHLNSAVVYRGYALLVEGNSHVAAIGMTKAAHIVWRAQEVYLMPVSQFADLATALKASCKDLQGKKLPGLSELPNHAYISDQVISDNDCASVDAMIKEVGLEAAVEDLCPHFKPILAKDPPPLCPKGSKVVSWVSEDFETSRWKKTGWSVESVNSILSYWKDEEYDWVRTDKLPPQNHPRAGHAMFAQEAPFRWCRDMDEDNLTSDVVGHRYLTTPTVHVGADGEARVAFTHYVATDEELMSSGYLEISVNGEDFHYLPKDFFVYNPYNAVLEKSDALQDNITSTIPDDQDVFIDTDTGSTAGSWGQSLLDLKDLVKPGDSVQLRFAFRSFCGRYKGWLVDDVNLYTCEAQNGKDGKSEKDGSDGQSKKGKEAKASKKGGKGEGKASGGGSKTKNAGSDGQSKKGKDAKASKQGGKGEGKASGGSKRKNAGKGVLPCCYLTILSLLQGAHLRLQLSVTLSTPSSIEPSFL
eukprot:g80827.t1